MSRPALFAAVMVACFAGSVLAGDLTRTMPHPSLSPKDVVAIIMTALRDNDRPHKNRGIEVTFNFASPANKSATGPLARFIPMVKGPVYGLMIEFKSISYENIRVARDNAEIDVILGLSGGKFAGYRFQLSRQRGAPFKGSWMTDSVIPINVTSL